MLETIDRLTLVNQSAAGRQRKIWISYFANEVRWVDHRVVPGRAESLASCLPSFELILASLHRVLKIGRRLLSAIGARSRVRDVITLAKRYRFVALRAVLTGLQRMA